MTAEVIKDKLLDNIPLVIVGMFALIFVGLYFESKKERDK
jgi:ABC-type phosphate transport system permease subunit